MHAAVFSGRDAKHAAIGLQPRGRSPLWLSHARAAQVFEKLHISGRVARDDVRVAVLVPVAAYRRGQGATLELVGLLLEITRRQKTGRAVVAQLAEGGRMVGVLAPDGGPGRACLWMRHGGSVFARLLFDANTPALPGFAPIEGFVFQ